MARTFAITTPTDTLRLNADGGGEITFTVTNTANRAARARLKVRPLESAQSEWFTLNGDTERMFPQQGTEQVSIKVRAIPSSFSGKPAFRLDVISVDDPDDDYSEGPAVALQMGLPAAPKKPFPWWMLITACAGLVLLAVMAYIFLPKPPSPKLRETSILIVGHKDHGKTTLQSAISWVLSKKGQATFIPYYSINTKPTSQVDFKTKKGNYHIIDALDTEAITRILQGDNPKIEAAILVVSAEDGPMPQTREHIASLKQKGIKALTVFVNKLDRLPGEGDDPETRKLMSLVELEVRDLVKTYGFPGDQVPVIEGSALKATQGDPRWEKSIEDLLKSIEDYIEPKLQP